MCSFLNAVFYVTFQLFRSVRNVTTLEGLFSAISVATGGTTEDLDASYEVSFDNISVDLVNSVITANGFKFDFFDIEATIHAESAIFDLNNDVSTVTLLGFLAVGSVAFIEIEDFIKNQLNQDLSEVKFDVPTTKELEDFLNELVAGDVDLIKLGDKQAPDDSLLIWLE